MHREMGMRWQSTVLYGRRAASIMARAPQYKGTTVRLPARLTPAMRRDWLRVDGWATHEQMDAIYEALKRHAVPDGDGDRGHG